MNMGTRMRQARAANAKKENGESRLIAGQPEKVAKKKAKKKAAKKK